MGKPLTSTVAPATTASNFTGATVASALSTVTSSVSARAMNDTVGSCYKLTPYWGNLWRPLDDPDYPWLGLWTSLFITAVWYFCTDQVYASSIPQGPNSFKVLMIDISLRFSTWSRSWSGAIFNGRTHGSIFRSLFVKKQKKTKREWLWRVTSVELAWRCRQVPGCLN